MKPAVAGVVAIDAQFVVDDLPALSVPSLFIGSQLRHLSAVEQQRKEDLFAKSQKATPVDLIFRRITPLVCDELQFNLLCVCVCVCTDPPSSHSQTGRRWQLCCRVGATGATWLRVCAAT